MPVLLLSWNLAFRSLASGMILNAAPLIAVFGRASPKTCVLDDTARSPEIK